MKGNNLTNRYITAYTSDSSGSIIQTNPSITNIPVVIETIKLCVSCITFIQNYSTVERFKEQ
ncbi:MAG: hypothetical protein SNI70_11500 [Rikenellaceae bacterium]